MQIKHELLRPREVANLLNVSQTTVYTLFHRGLLPGIHVGKSLRFHASTVRLAAEKGLPLDATASG